MLVTSIITRLPPAVDGVGDYALNLALRLRKDFDIETHFIVGDPTWTGATEIEGFLINQVSGCSANALLSLLPSDRQQPTIILLHYVNYGYAKRGCPVWLVDGLQRWRTARACFQTSPSESDPPKSPLKRGTLTEFSPRSPGWKTCPSVDRFVVSMFHEVYASGPPWTSSFWLSPLQRNLAARLAQLSDRCLSSRQDYAKLLYKLSLGKHPQIPTLPVFSTLGEPDWVPPLAERERRIVVIGSPSNRLRVYRESFAELELTCQLLGIEEIWDIGPSTNLTLSTVNGASVVELGSQPAAEISSILSNSLVGFFNYNPEFLAKSTIFAAYCAHGLLPVSPQCSALPVDGIEAGKHYWMPEGSTTGLKELQELQAIADNAYTWYQTHNLSVQARIFFRHLKNSRTSL